MDAPPASAAPEGKRPAWRWTLLANAASLAALLWIGLGTLELARAVRGQRFVGLMALPPVAVYVAMVAIAAVLVVVAVGARLRGAGPEHRVFRLLPVAAVLAVAVHVFVLPPYHPPFPAPVIAAAQLSMVSELVTPGHDGRVPTDPAAVTAALGGLVPPWLKDGAVLERWQVLVRENCSAPMTELPAGVEPGTLLYCVSADRRKAWATAVGTAEKLAGSPAIVQWEGAAAVAMVEQEDPSIASEASTPPAPADEIDPPDEP